jgi:hypothetical protein
MKMSAQKQKPMTTICQEQMTRVREEEDPGRVGHGRHDQALLVDVEDEPEGEHDGDEEQERGREIGPPRQAVEKPGVEGDDEADEQGRGQLGERPPARRGADQEALLDRLDDVEGESDQEEVCGQGQRGAGFAAADVPEAFQDPFEPAVGHSPPPSGPREVRPSRSSPRPGRNPRGSRGPWSAW